MSPRREIEKQRSGCWPDSLLPILKREVGKGGQRPLRTGVVGKGRRAIEKRERGKNCVKRTLSPPGLGRGPFARRSDGPGAKRSGERSSAAGGGRREGAVPGRARKKAGRKQQLSGRPGASVSTQALQSEGCDGRHLLGGRAAAEGPS